MGEGKKESPCQKHLLDLTVSREDEFTQPRANVLDRLGLCAYTHFLAAIQIDLLVINYNY